MDKIKIKWIDWFDDRFYEVEHEDGNREFFPSVTSILSASPNEFLARWRGDVGNREADRRMNEGAEIGSRVHHACYTYALGGVVLFRPPSHKRQALTEKEIADYISRYPMYAELPTQEELVQALRFRKFMEATGARVVYAEKTVYSLKHRYAGMMDYLFEIEAGTYKINGSEALKLKSGLYVADLKTSKVISDEAPLQISAYAHAVEELNLGEVVGGLVLHTVAQTRSGIEGFATKYINQEELQSNQEMFLNLKRVFDWKHPNNKPKSFQFPSVFAMDMKDEDSRSVADYPPREMPKQTEPTKAETPVPPKKGKK